MNNLIILNFILTSVLLAVVGWKYRPKKTTRKSFEETVASAAMILDDTAKWLEVERLARLSKPIHHPKIDGPTTSALTRTHGYWRPKSDPKAEPFLAAWYEKDMTVGGFPASFASDRDEVIPADTYVDLLGRKIPGAKFREHYEPSEAVVVVAKIKTKLRSSNLITASVSGTTLSPEEEEELAEEYELGVRTPDQAS